jgi:DtxR family Mn-dependent transcriptional regulator
MQLVFQIVATAVLVFLAIAILTAFAVAVFLPAGVIRRRWNSWVGNDRVRVEDSLKHLYDCEYAQIPATVHSLAGTLEIGRDAAARLLTRLEQMGLVKPVNQTLQLTAEGRSYALRVIRIHRLWEKYLADRTGIDESEWHRNADLKEHTMSAKDADALAARLGNPSFDPHGDPIPTAAGAMPSQRGMPLTSLQPGATARIVHVEDEPQAVYAQLVASQLVPGIALRVLQSEPDRMRIEAEMQEHVLAPVVAANLSVEPIGDALDPYTPNYRLSSLEIGQAATIVDISPACRGIERRRLLDLGVVPGTHVRAELRSPSGDPVAYRVRGAVIALREDQADLIHVRTPSDAPTPNSA